MSIIFNPHKQTFHLQASTVSYVIKLERGLYPSCAYWGDKLADWNGSSDPVYADRPFEPNPISTDRAFSLDTIPQEYPTFGSTDFRSPACQVQLEDGSTISNLVYKSHRIFSGKPALSGLPSVYIENEKEADTLELTLHDEHAGIDAVLTYTVLNKYSAISRSVRFENRGKRALKLLRAASANVDMPHSDCKMIQLSGSWARERNLLERQLAPGTNSIESRRGASSHQHNPFIALAELGANEDRGNVWAMSLVYSGNFMAQAEVDQFGGTRLSIGINPFEFSWKLEPGDSFQTPEAILVHSPDGLNGLSQTFHALYRERLCRGPYRDEERPVLINNWEGTYFDFDEEKILALAEEAAPLGIQLLVLDDGWFGKRNDDTSSLGDWVVDRKKLPGGLSSLGEGILKRNLRFGLWFEPEMISPDSDLYRRQPDWCLHVAGRARSQGRNQLVLDLGRKEVQDYIVDSVGGILASAPISYVKWDMNRHQTEAGSASLPPDRQKETSHRYILGLYSVLERITAKFPEVLFESCSGGGGRFDPGMLYYMPQTWTSDNTDAVSRLKIQYGTSIVYPVISMGAHVSAVPNHQIGRVTPLDFRAKVAMSGNLGYELDLGKLTADERDAIRSQVAEYKKVRRLVQFGRFFRLLSPFEHDGAAWCFVSQDRKEAFFSYFLSSVTANTVPPILKLKGLEPNFRYRLNGSEESYGGDELMRAGLRIPIGQGDYQSYTGFLELEEGHDNN